MDAFQDIGTWKRPEELLGECDFIVVARPGYSPADVGRALPKALRPPEATLRALGKQRTAALELPGATIHLLHEVREHVSSTQVRAAAHKSVQQLSRFVPVPVAKYIKKQRLYVVTAANAGAGVAPRGTMLSLHRITRSRKHE